MIHSKERKIKVDDEKSQLVQALDYLHNGDIFHYQKTKVLVYLD